MGGPIELEPFNETVTRSVGATFGRGVLGFGAAVGLLMVIAGLAQPGAWALAVIGAVVATASVVGLVRRIVEHRAAARIRHRGDLKGEV